MWPGRYAAKCAGGHECYFSVVLIKVYLLPNDWRTRFLSPAVLGFASFVSLARPVMKSGKSKHLGWLLTNWLAGIFFVASSFAGLADQITPAELCFRRAYAEKLTAIILDEGVSAIPDAKIDREALLSACNVSVALPSKAQIPDGATSQPSGGAAPAAPGPETSQKPLSSSLPSVGATAQPNAATEPNADQSGTKTPPRIGWVDEPGPNASNPASDSAAGEQDKRPKTGWVSKPAQPTGASDASIAPSQTAAPRPSSSDEALPMSPGAAQNEGASATPPPTDKSVLHENNQPSDTTITDGPVADKSAQPAAEIEEGLPPPARPTPGSDAGLPLPAKSASQSEAASAPDKPNAAGAPTDVSADNPVEASPDASTVNGGLLGGLGKADKPREESTKANTPSGTGPGPSDTKASGAGA
jgi:hypothetical protein